MEYVLDSPAWHALISGNADMAYGNEQVKYFDKEVSPFAAFRENTVENFEAFYEMLQQNSTVLFMTPVEMDIPAPWTVSMVIKGLQMLYSGSGKIEQATMEPTPLTSAHVSQMIGLTKLTNPGPFAQRTIDFGHYHGFFEEDQLVAMAGQRMHAYNYAEISAVCTHPDHTGKGYARQLLLHQVHRITLAGETPFLHVRYDNERAIKVYERLGFSIRSDMYFYVLKKGQ